MLHIHYLTTLETFNTAVAAFHAVWIRILPRSHLYWQAVRGTTRQSGQAQIMCHLTPKKLRCVMKEVYSITFHCKPVSHIHKPQYWQSVWPDRKCMHCKWTELKLDTHRILDLRWLKKSCIKHILVIFPFSNLYTIKQMLVEVETLLITLRQTAAFTETSHIRRSTNKLPLLFTQTGAYVVPLKPLKLANWQIDVHASSYFGDVCTGKTRHLVTVWSSVHASAVE